MGELKDKNFSLLKTIENAFLMTIDIDDYIRLMKKAPQGYFLSFSFFLFSTLSLLPIFPENMVKN